MEHREYVTLAFWARRRLQLIANGEDQATDTTEDQISPDETPADAERPPTGLPLAA